jgi:hypothetical protein
VSWVTLAPERDRPGHLVCACDLTGAPTSAAVGSRAAGVASAASVFAFTILAQALSMAVLPTAGLVLAPSPAEAAWPYALTLVGAGVATFPATLLTDLFGRRAALALAASLGLAGGILAATSFAAGQFPGLLLGAFWLGVAQGFGFFYRHAAIPRASDKTQTIAVVLGSGSLAALAAPGIMALSRSLAGPLAPAAALLSAGAAQVVILGLAMTTSPGGGLGAAKSAEAPRPPVFVAATAAAAIAWFAMTALMARAPPSLALCGVGAAGASGWIAVHILSMYAPAALLGTWADRLGAGRLAAVGVLAALAALLGAGRATTALEFEAAMMLAGCGWGLALLGATLAIHRDGSPSPRLLALHDGVLFCAAVAGALTVSLAR